MAKNIAKSVFEVIEPVAKEMNLDIWDVRFEKEGHNWFLRIFIDKDNGVNINDCEKFSEKIDHIIDEIDPIDCSYFLEVSSPGVNRELVKDWHITKYINQKININFIRPIYNGLKNIIATLIGFDNNIITVLLDDGYKLSFDRKEVASLKLYFDININENK